MSKLTDDQLDQLALDTAECLSALCMKWRGHEQQIARSIAGTLGAFVAIHAGDPKAALDFVAAAIRNTDHQAVRTAHFGAATLGVDESVPLSRPRPAAAIFLGNNPGRKPT